MRNTLRKFSSVLTLITLLFSTGAFALPSLKDYKKKVGDLVYSLNSLENGKVLERLNWVDKVAAEAMPVKLGAEVAVNMLTALELLKVLVEDTTFKPEDKKDMVLDLVAALGRNLSTIDRHQGDDELNPEGEGDDNPNSKSTKLPLAIKLLKTTSLEFLSTFTDLLSFPKTFDNKRTYKFIDRMVREYISQDIVIYDQHLVAEVRSVDADNKALKAFLFNQVVPDKKKNSPTDLGTAEKALIVRKNRLGAHYIVLGTIGVSILSWTLSGADWFGFATDGYSLTTARISDFLFYTSAITVGLIRAASGSFGVIPPLERLIDIINNPKKSPEFSELKLPLMAQIFRIQKKVDEAKSQFCKAGLSKI